MSIEFLCDAIWPRIQQAAVECKEPAYVAVAYFGQGASQLLPLKKGSRLVVDASEGAVKSGQTCPRELHRLLHKGVRIYSQDDLHAKVFVLGNQVFVGSANASQRSAHTLTECCIITTDPSVVSQTREFVRELCIYRLTPAQLDALARIYRPPRPPGGKRRLGQSAAAPRPKHPLLKLVQLVNELWPEREAPTQTKGEEKAKQKRRYGRGWQVDCFRWSGTDSFQRDDRVVRVMDLGGGRCQVHRPAHVIHVQRFRSVRGKAAYVYLESPADEQPLALSALARKLGGDAKEQLCRSGPVKDFGFAHNLLKILEG